MTPPRTPQDSASANAAAFDERLNGLESATREGFKRVEALLQALDERLRAIETATVTKIAVMETQLTAAWKKIDEHEAKFKKVEDDIQDKAAQKDVDGLKDFRTEQMKINEKMLSLRSVLIWIGVILGGMFFSLLWALWTGQVEIVQVVK